MALNSVQLDDCFKWADKPGPLNTVGGLVEFLRTLPSDMPIAGTWERTISPINEVYLGIDCDGKSGLLIDVD